MDLKIFFRMFFLITLLFFLFSVQGQPSSAPRSPENNGPGSSPKSPPPPSTPSNPPHAPPPFSPSPLPNSSPPSEWVAPPPPSAEPTKKSGMNGGQKAGIGLGVLAGAAVIGLGGTVYKKRRSNIRRARFGQATRLRTSFL